MNNLMSYKGYHAKIEYSAEDAAFVGRVLGIDDVLAFDGETVSELEAMFHECIDGYLDMCARMGRQPDKTYKGSFNVRISPELHRKSVIEAEARDISLNQFVQQSIENELRGNHTGDVITVVIPQRKVRAYALDTQKDYSAEMFGEREVLLNGAKVRA